MQCVEVRQLLMAKTEFEPHFSRVSMITLDLCFEIYNSTLFSENIPPSWTSVILPIPKPGKSCKDSSSCHEIALTLVACKICECMLVKHLSNFLLQHKFLDNYIYAFFHSTTAILPSQCCITVFFRQSRIRSISWESSWTSRQPMTLFILMA